MKTLLIVLPLLLAPLPSALSLFSKEPPELKQGDIFHFGLVDEKSHFDARFKVLDAKRANTGDEGVFLLLESLVSNEGSPVAFRKEKDEEHNSYTGSYAKAWCAHFYEERFDGLEKDYILPTHLSDEAYSVPAAFSFGGKTPNVDFAAEDNILDGDHLFLLSAKEASSESYGLATAENRLASYDGVTASYWLRSPHDRRNFPNDVGIVFYNGWLMDFIQDSDNVFGASPIYMRPAINLRKIAGEELYAISENEYCLKQEKDRFVHPSPAPSYTERNPLPAFIAIGIASLLLLIGMPILIVILAKRHKRKKSK